MSNAVNETTSPTATPTRKRRGRPANATRGIRSGAGAGMAVGTGTTGNPGALANLTAVEAYQLGIRHGCDLGGIAWPALTKR